MAGDHPVPVERQHSIERVEEVGQEAVGKVAELEALDGDEVHREEQLFLRQQHHQRVVRVVSAHVVQLEPRATELDGVEVPDADVGDDHVGVLQRLQARLRVHVRDERGARVLEGLAALDVM